MRVRRSTTLSLLFWVLGVVSAFISDQVQDATPRIHTEEKNVTNKLTFKYAKGNIKVLPKEVENLYKPEEVRCFNRHAYMEDQKPSWNCHDQGSAEEKLFLATAYKIECTAIRPSASERSKDRFDPESCTLSMTYRFTALGREKHLSGKWSFSWLRWFLIPAGAFVLYQSVAFYNQRKRRMADETERRTKEQTPYRKKLRSHKRGCQTE